MPYTISSADTLFGSRCNDGTVTTLDEAITYAQKRQAMRPKTTSRYMIHATKPGFGLIEPSDVVFCLLEPAKVAAGTKRDVALVSPVPSKTLVNGQPTVAWSFPASVVNYIGAGCACRTFVCLKDTVPVAECEADGLGGFIALRVRFDRHGVL